MDIKIPLGYKQTEIGVIPEEWEVKKLNNYLDFEQPTSYLVSDTEYNDNNSTPVLTAGKTFILGYTNEEYGIFNKLPVIIFDDFTTAIKFVNFPFKAKSSAMKMLLPKHNKINLRLVYEAMLQIKFPLGDHKRHWICEYQNIEIAIPNNTAEQTAIVTALSDTDSLIEHLEKLIDKKKAIKQGAMQQLLTGKKRLAGFNGEWVRKKIGEIGEITGSGVDKKSSSEEIPIRLVNFLNVYHQSFIYSKDLNHLVTARPDQIARCSVRAGDIFFTPSSEMPFDIGLSAVAMEDMSDVVYSYHIDRLRLFEDWDLLFRAYIFQTKDFYDQTATQCEGSGKRYVLNLATFRERLTVYYPIDKKEQTAIATILSDMDYEIEKLEKNRDKYVMIKQGMMQQLLTGKIRIYENK